MKYIKKIKDHIFNIIAVLLTTVWTVCVAVFAIGGLIHCLLIVAGTFYLLRQIETGRFDLLKTLSIKKDSSIKQKTI